MVLVRESVVALRRKAHAAALDYDATRVGSGKTGYVYVFEGAGLFKIGRSLDAKKRLAGVQNMSPVPIRMVYAARCADYTAVERDLHEIYKDRRHHGEWFALTPEDVRELGTRMGVAS